MERIYAIAQGQVQGVGFRYFIQTLARTLHLTGWVRNMRNGMVEMELQGEESDLHQALRRIQRGDRFIQVSDLHTKTLPLHPQERQFRVRFDDETYFR